MDARLRYRLQGLLAGLLALALTLGPVQHARAALETAAYALAYAMPDGTLPEICSGDHAPGDDHGQHAGAPVCVACLIVGLPALVAPPAVAPARSRMATAAGFGPGGADAGRQVVWTLQRARAPPSAAIA